MLSSCLEIVLIVQGKYAYASASYGLSDVLRAAALILPALLFRRIGWLLAGAIAVALLGLCSPWDFSGGSSEVGSRQISRY